MRVFWIVAVFLMFLPAVHAADGEIGFLFGGGGVTAGGEAAAVRAYSLGVGGLFLDRWGAEVCLEGFALDRDRGYDGLQVDVQYHFRSHAAPRTVIPYVVAGVGFRSDDWTELPSYTTLRLGGGLRYYPWRFLGIRAEAGDDIVFAGESGYGAPFPGRVQHVLGVRAGVCLRF